VLKNRLESGILAGIGPLVVPIDGFKLFHQRNNGAVHVAGFNGKFIDRFVIANTGHWIPLIVVGD
jgi:hypothetical protein